MVVAVRSSNRTAPLPRRFAELAQLLPPRAISGASQYDATRRMVDRLMTAGRLSAGQRDYMETLVQLVEAYEAAHLAIDVSGLSALDVLRHLMTEHGMTASGVARLLGVHVTMGSKLLNGERSLTVAHVQTLARHFAVSPALFLDAAAPARRP